MSYDKIDYNDIYYYAAPKMNPAPKSLDEVDPEILKTYEKLGIPLREQEILAGVEPRNRVAVDAVFDSVSVATTFKAELDEGRRDLHADLGGDPRVSGPGAEVSRHRRAGDRQLLRDAELGGLHGRLVRLHAAGRALPDGAVDLFPHQREEYRPVRAHADHRRQGLLRVLSRGLHGARSATRTSSTPPWSS